MDINSLSLSLLSTVITTIAGPAFLWVMVSKGVNMIIRAAQGREII